MKYFATVFFAVFSLSLSAQIMPGTRQIALAHSGTAVRGDAFSVYENPAGIAGIGSFQAGVFYSPSPFGMTELKTAAVAAAGSFKEFSAGVSAMSYGFDLYAQSSLSLSAALPVMKEHAAGITASLVHLKIRGYGDASSLSFGAGGIIHLAKNLDWGISALNFFATQTAGGRIASPVALVSGLHYNLDGIHCTAALRKEDGADASTHWGISYSPVDEFEMMLGFTGNPAELSAGVQVRAFGTGFQYAVFQHGELGLTHQAGIVFNY